jgi:hypothetical protein
MLKQVSDFNERRRMYNRGEIPWEDERLKRLLNLCSQFQETVEKEFKSSGLKKNYTLTLELVENLRRVER